MYFYIDESGNTGNNLFDPQQPILYYGVISSVKNLDVVAKAPLSLLRDELGVDRIHANELGNAGLPSVANKLTDLQKRHDIRFDLYLVNKKDHAAISFFDQVFDQGMNPAVPWTAYWTPLRYLLLFKVASLFDEKILEKAWIARASRNDLEANKLLVEVCEELLSRIHVIPDARSREIISDALTWAASNVEKIEYNASDKDSSLQISPNLIGFQQVMQGIATRINSVGREAKSIIVDRQNQFNSAQRFLADYYAKLRGEKFPMGPGLPEIDYSSMPLESPKFVSSSESAGLEIVDVYLWAFKRGLENKFIIDELRKMIYLQRHRGKTDAVSLEGIYNRWAPLLTDDSPLTQEQIKEAKEFLEKQEEYRKKAMRDIT